MCAAKMRAARATMHTDCNSDIEHASGSLSIIKGPAIFVMAQALAPRRPPHALGDEVLTQLALYFDFGWSLLEIRESEIQMRGRSDRPKI
jgi:hypothetical protein